MPFHLVLVLATTLVAPPQERPADCATWQICRTLALEAADRQDFEAFHDLSWRAVRKGRPNDTELMQMLARAQSLSGRPLDSLVMLERLLALGVTTDAATNGDFRRVRALPGWSEFEKRAAESVAGPSPAPDRPVGSEPVKPWEPAPDRTATPDRPPDSAAPPSGATSARPATNDKTSASGIPGKNPKTRGKSRGVPPEAPKNAPAADAPVVAEPVTPLSGDATEALRFTTIAFTPAGLAYDRVSNRFIVGDRDASKLTVVDEASQRVANLAGAQSAGFGSIAAFEIDAREGDLWVVSTGEPATPAATLHKLQLISGRVLYAVALEPSFGPARFTDIAVTPRSSVLVLDSDGRRVFVAAPKARRLELALELDVTNPSSLAPESDSVVYVAHRDGILRADLAAGKSRALTAPKSVSLAGLTRLRWHRGALLGVQTSGDGTHRIVQLKLDASGHRVTGVNVLDRSLRMTDPTAASLAGDILYYLAAPTAADEAMRLETIVKRVTVK
jgi:hypothetical protein